VSDGTFGLLVSIALVAVLAGLAHASRLPRTVKTLLVGAIFLRLIGAIARHTVIEEFYGGVGDARFYFNTAREYALRFAQWDFSPFYDAMLWTRTSLWGTQFVTYPASLVVWAIGPSYLGSFIFFSLFSFLGLCGFVIAFRRMYPHVPLWRYARWVWFFPALWFWPSSIGKESLLLMGTGLAVWGFVGRNGRVNWLLLGLGTFLVFAVRPPYAAVLFFAVTLAFWLPAPGGWTAKTVLQGIVILVIGYFGLQGSFQQMGVDGFDLGGIQNYMEANTALSEGGSQIEAVGPSITGVPMALVNILVRPFPWDVNNLMMAFAAVEIGFLWLVAYRRRRHLKYVLRNWRADRLLRLAVIFIPLYAVMLGLLLANLGIIARQRLFIFPFVFILFEAIPIVARRRPRPAVPRYGPHVRPVPEVYPGRVQPPPPRWPVQYR